MLCLFSTTKLCSMYWKKNLCYNTINSALQTHILLQRFAKGLQSTHTTTIFTHALCIYDHNYVLRILPLYSPLSLSTAPTNYFLDPKLNIYYVLGEFHFWTRIKGAQIWWNSSITITTCAFNIFTPIGGLYQPFVNYPLNFKASMDYQVKFLRMCMRNLEKNLFRASIARTTLAYLDWKYYIYTHNIGKSQLEAYSCTHDSQKSWLC